MDKCRKTITGDYAINTPGTEMLSWDLTRQGDVSDSSRDWDPTPGSLHRERSRGGPPQALEQFPPLAPGDGHSHGSDTAGHYWEQAGARAQQGSRDPRSHLQQAGGGGKEGAHSY